MSDEMSEQLVAFLKEARVIRGSLDKHLADVEQQTETFLAAQPRTLPLVTSYIDTWQYNRAKIFKYHWKVIRHLEDARDSYGEGLRIHMSKGLSGKHASFHYEERAEVYKTKNLGAYQQLRILEKLDVELRAIQRHFDRKISWLEDMRRQMRREEDGLRFASNRDYQGS